MDSCYSCQRRKKPRNLVGQLHTIDARDKFEQVQIDLYSGLPPTRQGYTSIMVVTDVVTKYVVLAPLLHKTPTEVAKTFWDRFVIYHGFPTKVQTYRGILNLKH